MAMRIDKAWGHEEIIHNGEYCCKKLVYTHRLASSLHFHKVKHETFVIGAGEFALTTRATENPVGLVLRPGDFVVLPPCTPHRIRCLKPGFIVEASTHDDPEDCVRIIPSEEPIL